MGIVRPFCRALYQKGLGRFPVIGEHTGSQKDPQPRVMYPRTSGSFGFNNRFRMESSPKVRWFVEEANVQPDKTWAKDGTRCIDIATNPQIQHYLKEIHSKGKEKRTTKGSPQPKAAEEDWDFGAAVVDDDAADGPGGGTPKAVAAVKDKEEGTVDKRNQSGSKIKAIKK